MFTLLHKWFIDRSVRTGAPAPAWTRRAEARSRELQTFRARLSRLERALQTAPPAAHPSPRIRQAVLDAARLSPAPATPRHAARPVLWLSAAAAAAAIAVSAPFLFRQPSPALPDQPIARGSDPSHPGPADPEPTHAGPTLPDTGIATVLSARPDLAAAAPLLEEARRLEADTRAVRDRLLARIPLIHDQSARSGDL